MKGKFIGHLDLRHSGVKRWKLLAALIYESIAGTRYTAPADFETDLASVPRFLWPIFPPHGKYAPAAVIHDWMLESGFDRKVCDLVFLEGMKTLGVVFWRRWTVYAGVRAWYYIKQAWAWLERYKWVLLLLRLFRLR